MSSFKLSGMYVAVLKSCQYFFTLKVPSNKFHNQNMQQKFSVESGSLNLYLASSVHIYNSTFLLSLFLLGLYWFNDNRFCENKYLVNKTFSSEVYLFLTDLT